MYDEYILYKNAAEEAEEAELSLLIFQTFQMKLKYVILGLHFIKSFKILLPFHCGL